MLSNKWGFTNLTRLEYQQKIAEGSIKPDGVGIKVLRPKGPLDKSALFQATASK
jgi:hypothetical protein